MWQQSAIPGEVTPHCGIELINFCLPCLANLPTRSVKSYWCNTQNLVLGYCYHTERKNYWWTHWGTQDNENVSVGLVELVVVVQLFPELSEHLRARQWKWSHPLCAPDRTTVQTKGSMQMTDNKYNVSKAKVSIRMYLSKWLHTHKDHANTSYPGKVCHISTR